MASLLRKTPTAVQRSSVLAARPMVPAIRSSPRLAPRNVRMADSASNTPTPSGDDFDALLAKMADKWEKADNKPVVIGWVSAAVAYILIAEWLIHLPALDVLLGFPVQLLGVLSLPILGVRYFMDGKDATSDVEQITADITSKLPGLKKE